MKTGVMIAVVAVVIAVPAFTWAKDGDQKKTELKIELPKALFDGTPSDMKGDLGPDTGRRRKAFYVPKGSDTVLSRGKKVTSSEAHPFGGPIDMVTDGEKEGIDGCFVELGPGKQWVQVDLGEDCVLSAVLVWHYHKMARIYRDVVVQVADDQDFVTNVRTLFNSDKDNTSGLGIGKDFEYIETNEGKLVDAKGCTARYVRLYSNGGSASEMNHYIEVEVYGSKGKGSGPATASPKVDAPKAVPGS